jgi:DNA-binding transcriptional MocR family regulator
VTGDWSSGLDLFLDLDRRRGLRVPVDDDDDGLVVAELERCDAAAVLVTPAHQFPLGVTMTASERSIALHTLGEYWQVPPRPASTAIIIGYAAPASHAYRPALDALASLLTALQDTGNWTNKCGRNWSSSGSH